MSRKGLPSLLFSAELRASPWWVAVDSVSLEVFSPIKRGLMTVVTKFYDKIGAGKHLP